MYNINNNNNEWHNQHMNIYASVFCKSLQYYACISTYTLRSPPLLYFGQLFNVIYRQKIRDTTPFIAHDKCEPLGSSLFFAAYC